jgi:hypothetical protein
MKKSLLALALLAATVSAFAAQQPAKPVVASAAHPVAASAAAAPAAVATNNATVTVSGASTVEGAPLLLSLHGEKAAEPSFQTLFDAAQSHPKWTVTDVKPLKNHSRLYLKSASDAATMEMDIASKMATDLKVVKGATVEAQTQRSGEGALIKFTKDLTPIGFLVNQTTTISQSK